jgi:DNA-binding NtrC family response regulator
MMRQASILVVDDDEDIRRIVTRTLENMGYAVLHVGSGDEAALAMASQRFRLAVVDLKMRDLGGQKAVMEMHRHDSQMRIIVMFGSPDTPIGELRATAQGWLYKPFRPEELRLTVERVLGGASQEEP